ncbi:MAG: penicillin-binding protein activator [Neptuniibacter sp.]
MKFHRHLSLSVIVFCLAVAGCAPTSSIKEPELTDAQKKRAAITTLIQNAEKASEPEASKIRAEAAQKLIDQQQLSEALELINQINLLLISADERYNLGTIQISESINTGDPASALNQIDTLLITDAEILTIEQTLALYDLKLTSNKRLKQPFATIQTLIKIASLKDTQESIRVTHDEIWKTLTDIEPELISQRLHSGNSSYSEQGWLELYNALSTNKQLDTQDQALSDWRQIWNQHPANSVLPSLLAKLDQKAIDINTIAILLPFEGKFSSAAHAIKEGLLIAHFRQQKPGAIPPELIFLDSTKINTPHQLAIILTEAQADLVIGPLNKNFVSELINSTDIKIPILALNYSEKEFREGLYQFGLSASDEARQVAIKAHDDGVRKVALLTPNTSWGNKIRESFKVEFESLGGLVSTEQSFEDSQSFSDKASLLLNTHTSSQRYKLLKQTVNTRKIEFEEHRRTDIDAIILSALPNDARQLSPILAFNFAGNLPIYSTSHVFSGTADPVLDQDLNKIKFLATPWSLLPPTQNKILLSQERKDTNSRMGRLYALGIDAYRIHPYLKQLSALPGTEIKGETGTLSLNQMGQVERNLLWARYKDGTPLLIE